MVQSTAGWEGFFSWIFSSESPRHYLGDICCYALNYYHLPSPAWKPSEDLLVCLNSVLEVDPFDSLSTWRFQKFPLLLTSRPSRYTRQWRPSLEGPPRPHHKGWGSPQFYYHDCSGTSQVTPQGHHHCPPVDFELATNDIQFYVIANLDKTSPIWIHIWFVNHDHEFNGMNS